MKTVYKKFIEEKILDAQKEAHVLNKDIDFILLTRGEALELYGRYFIDISCPYTFGKSDESKASEVHNGEFYGVKLKVEGL